MNKTTPNVHYVENPEYHPAYAAMLAARNDLTTTMDAFANGNSIQDDVDVAFAKVTTAEAVFYATPQFKELIG